jgi:hypothetical protein
MVARQRPTVKATVRRSSVGHVRKAFGLPASRVSQYPLTAYFVATPIRNRSGTSFFGLDMGVLNVL